MYVLLILLVQPLAPVLADEGDVLVPDSPAEENQTSEVTSEQPEQQSDSSEPDVPVDPSSAIYDVDAETDASPGTDDGSAPEAGLEPGAETDDAQNPEVVASDEGTAATGNDDTELVETTPEVVLTDDEPSAEETAPLEEDVPPDVELPTTTPTDTPTLEDVTLPQDEITAATSTEESEAPGEMTPESNEATSTGETTAPPVTTEPATEELSESTVFNDENRFMFSKNECVSVGDGSFYCSTATTAPEVVGTDRVFSALDDAGDREIFIERAGELIQVSANQYDDDAPFYDKLSNSIVWQRLIDGRYQIVSYSVADGEERQLTSERYNNMEPSRYGDIIVWQGWVGNDWEIMLDEKGELTMLTDNTTHDISPRINGNYIIWQAFENDLWHVKVYDRLTGKTDTIENAEGASIDNPRFVLVYDAKQENGDVETKGYDLESGETVPLSSTPMPVPESIPDPDQTGEKRALLQQMSQAKPKQDAESGSGPEPTPDPAADDALSSTTSPGDVVVPTFENVTGTTTGTSSQTTEYETEEFETEVTEIVVPPFSENDAPVSEMIEDLVITPFVEPIEPETP